MAQPKRPTFTSPRGSFSYPKLTTPDTKFKPEGEYSVGLILSADSAEAKKLMAQIDKAAAESLASAKEKAKNPAEAKKWETKYLPYKMVEDKETGEETGDVEFKFSAKASGTTKDGKPWTRKPQIFDALGQNITVKGESLKIGGGTIGYVAFQIMPYAATIQSGASVKLALEAVQIVELRQFGQKDASGFGFGAHEGGFAGKDEQDEETNEETEESNEEGTPDF